MSRSTLIDRLNHELEAFGKKAQAALDEGKLQFELLRLRRRQDHTARDLGLMVHRRERGGQTEPRRIEALLQRIDDLQAEIARLERRIDESRHDRQPAAATQASPPESGPTSSGPASSGPASTGPASGTQAPGGQSSAL
jgi:outer membrane murein-binding lipoprotein Lpp